MDTALLQREPIVLDESLVDYAASLGEFDREVSRSLEYTGLNDDAAKLQTQVAIQQTLIDLDLRPFTSASVSAYKQACERKSVKRWPDLAASAAGVVLAGGLIALPVLIVGALLAATTVAFYAAVVVCAAILVCIACSVFVAYCGVDRYWRMHALCDYTQPVPEFVLQTALDIQKAHPDADFSICTLEENRVVVDPFLVLHGQGRDYYLEVWNEPTFKQAREA